MGLVVPRTSINVQHEPIPSWHNKENIAYRSALSHTKPREVSLSHVDRQLFCKNIRDIAYLLTESLETYLRLLNNIEIILKNYCNVTIQLYTYDVLTLFL